VFCNVIILFVWKCDGVFTFEAEYGDFDGKYKFIKIELDYFGNIFHSEGEKS